MSSNKNPKDKLEFFGNLVGSILLLTLYSMGLYLDNQSRGEILPTKVFIDNNTNSNSSGDGCMPEINIFGSNTQILYHYKLEVRTTDISPRFLEINPTINGQYRVEDHFKDEYDGYYEFDSPEYLGTLEEMYRYVKDHHLMPLR